MKRSFVGADGDDGGCDGGGGGGSAGMGGVVVIVRDELWPRQVKYGERKNKE